MSGDLSVLTPTDFQKKIRNSHFVCDLQCGGEFDDIVVRHQKSHRLQELTTVSPAVIMWHKASSLLSAFVGNGRRVATHHPALSAVAVRRMVPTCHLKKVIKSYALRKSTRATLSESVHRSADLLFQESLSS